MRIPVEPSTLVRPPGRWPVQPLVHLRELRLLAAGVPAGPIHDYDQVLKDPHTQARRMIEDVEHPAAGTVHTLGFPVKMRDTPLRVRRPPPLLGEHNGELRRELGLEPVAP